jgi:hypothetical protein
MQYEIPTEKIATMRKFPQCRFRQKARGAQKAYWSESRIKRREAMCGKGLTWVCRDAAAQSRANGISLASVEAKRCVTTTSWSRQSHREKEMPYLIGWLLGVPLIVLVILYLIFH